MLVSNALFMDHCVCMLQMQRVGTICVGAMRMRHGNAHDDSSRSRHDFLVLSLYVFICLYNINKKFYRKKIYY